MNNLNYEIAFENGEIGARKYVQNAQSYTYV
jgi:hypothetical protein